MVAKIVAIPALLGLVFSLPVWHKSHHHPIQHRYDLTLYKSLRVYVRNGVCGLRVLSMPSKVASRTEFHAELTYDPTPNKKSFVLSSTQNGPYRITWFVFPFWFTSSMLACTCAIPVVRGPLLRWRRKRNGSCITCGYSLIGNRSGRCPECGTRFRSVAKGRARGGP